ncbi:ankyrin repeat domain-containing protein 26-like [Microtus ochrogaster]|uniref:Ankyrin repeat domain-containing protein 26-like n=1 Tax=Microtus ochrogaster TaxID=79684 RepID=A0ABM1USL6_MICOH|nr:ankyrin repeat domain-containing protein 26-like [Microtus ochrogaster]
MSSRTNMKIQRNSQSALQKRSYNMPNLDPQTPFRKQLLVTCFSQSFPNIRSKLEHLEKGPLTPQVEVLSVACKAGVSPLHRAASVGDVASVERLINFNQMPLHYACAHNHPAVVILLLSNFAGISIQDDEGYTPLIKEATQRDNVECVSIFLIQGAGAHAVDFSGDTALHRAISRDSTTIACNLLEYNANIEATKK